MITYNFWGQVVVVPVSFLSTVYLDGVGIFKLLDDEFSAIWQLHLFFTSVQSVVGG